MNPNPLELLLNSVALTSVIAFVAPKVFFHLSLRRLNKSTVGAYGAAAYKPKTMVCRKPIEESLECVKRALGKRQSDSGWIVRQPQAAKPRRKADRSQTIQIEAFLPAAKVAELRLADKNERGAAEANDTAVDIKIRVDIYERPEGSEIVWKYLPNSAADCEQRRELLDPRHNTLLWQTNSQLLTELEPQLVKA